MARALQIEFTGAVYLVTSRGTARQDIVVTTAIGSRSAPSLLPDGQVLSSLCENAEAKSVPRDVARVADT